MSEHERRSILLVEDEAIIAMASSSMLKRHGYEVYTAFTGQQAVEEVKHHGLDLVLMDIDLGSGMDGAQTAITIGSLADLPVLFLSGHTEPEIVEKTEGIGGFGYVVKSSGDTVLLASIRMALRLHDAKVEIKRKTEALEEANEELRRKRSEYESLLETSPMAVGILRDRRFVMVNEAMRRLFGYEREEMIGNLTRMLYVDDEEYARVGKRLYDEVRERGSSKLRTRLRKKDGSAIEVDVYCRPLDPTAPEPERSVSTILEEVVGAGASESAGL